MLSRADVGLGSNSPVAGLVGQSQAELGVDLGLVGGVGAAQHGEQVRQGCHHGYDLVAAHRFRSCVLGDRALSCLVLGALGFGFGDPAGDDGGVCPGVQGGPVLDQLAVTFGDLGADLVLLGGHLGRAGGRGDEFVNGGRQVACFELAREPGIERFQQRILAKGDVERMVDAVGEGVLTGEAAAVVRGGVGPVSLHAPVADAAEQDAAQRVDVLGAVGLVRTLDATAGGQEFLGMAECLVVDDRRMDDLLGVDPLVLVVPAHFGRVAERDVVDVDEDLVFALAVPDLAAGVPGVGEDGTDGVFGPCDAAAVPVAFGVVSGWAWDALSGQPLGNRVDTESGQELGEDALDYRCGVLVNRQDVQSLAVGGFGGIGVRPSVDQPVSVGWAAAEVAAFHLRLGGHGGSYPDLDPVPLTLGDATKHAHDQVVGFIVRVDWAAHLGHPQRHAVVLEQGVGVAELVAVESPLRLPHHHRVKAPVGVGERGEQLARFGPTLRGYGAGLVDVEELHNDDTAVRLDQGLTTGVLPGAGGLGVLAVFGRDPLPGCEFDQRVCHSHPFPSGPVAGRAGWSVTVGFPSAPPCAARALSRTRSRARAACGESCGGSSGSSTRTCLVCVGRRWVRRGARPGPAAGLRSYAADRGLGGLEQGLCGLPVMGAAARARCRGAVLAVPGAALPLPGNAGVPPVGLLAGCGADRPPGCGQVVPVIGHRCRCRARRRAAAVRRQGRQTPG